MSSERSMDIQLAVDLAWDMGDVMRHYFHKKVLASEIKEDGSPVTEADEFISDATVNFYRQRNRGVVSEEKGRTANYGDPDAEYLDPIDGTKDFEDGRSRNPKQSIAAFSIGSVTGGKFVRGVVNMPLLSSPRLYWAERGRGAYRVMGPDFVDKQLRIDPTPTSGIVLVSENHHPYIDYLESRGIRTIGIGGAVFKACAVADPSLMNTQQVSLEDDAPVIGFLSDSASAHDYAAAAAILEEAGGVTCGMDGNPLRLSAGKNGCVFANNTVVRDLLLDALHDDV